MSTLTPVKPCLWYDQDAEPASRYYVDLFGGEILHVDKYFGFSSPPEGTVITVRFKIRGVEFLAMNGGPIYTFTPAVSFSISCETQAEIDAYWDTMLRDGGKELKCGWINDKWGLSWQIVPTSLSDYLGGADKEGAGRARQAMMGMKKLVIAELQAAYEGH